MSESPFGESSIKRTHVIRETTKTCVRQTGAQRNVNCGHDIPSRKYADQRKIYTRTKFCLIVAFDTKKFFKRRSFNCRKIYIPGIPQRISLSFYVFRKPNLRSFLQWTHYATKITYGERKKNARIWSVFSALSFTPSHT